MNTKEEAEKVIAFLEGSEGWPIAARALRDFATHLETECKDAARYRWLRDKTIDVDVTMRALFSDVDRMDSYITCMYAELLRATDDLDAAIDAAMQAEGETK